MLTTGRKRPKRPQDGRAAGYSMKSDAAFIYCNSRRCHHAAVLVARSYADDVPVSAFSPRMVGDGLLIEVFPALGRIG